METIVKLYSVTENTWNDGITIEDNAVFYCYDADELCAVIDSIRNNHDGIALDNNAVCPENMTAYVCGDGTHMTIEDR